jgi:hypothetical protein
MGLTARAGSEPLTIALLLSGGFGCAFLYWRHTQNCPHPVLGLTVLKIPTVAAANVGGLFQRLVVSAVPFLLALLFQLGFGLTPLAAGGLIFASALGAVFGRWLLSPIVSRTGFRAFLIGNAVLLALAIAACALFNRDTPYAIIFSVLFVQGLLRALQLIGVTTLGYADLSDADIGTASAIASVSQQLAQSLGIVLSVLAVQLIQTAVGDITPTTRAISPAFLVIAGMSLISVLWFGRLPTDAGRELVGPRRHARPPVQGEP